MTDSPIQPGTFRLHWQGENGKGFWQDHSCLDHALNQAARVFVKGGKLLRLENDMGRNACPPADLIAVARMRAGEALKAHDQAKEQEAMESSPIYGAWG